MAAALVRLCAIVGPLLLGALTMLYTGRPAVAFFAGAAVLAIAILASDAWIIARRAWVTGVLALATHIALLLFLKGYSPSPFPAGASLSDPLPPASPPAGMALYVLPTGVNHRTAAFARRCSLSENLLCGE